MVHPGSRSLPLALLVARPGVETSSYGPARDGTIRRGGEGITTRSLDAWKERLPPATAARVAALVDGSAGLGATAAHHLACGRAWGGWLLRKAGLGGIRRRLGGGARG